MYFSAKREKKEKSLQRQYMYLSWHYIKQNIISYTTATHSEGKGLASTMQKIVLEEKSLLIVTETTYSLPRDLPLEYP